MTTDVSPHYRRMVDAAQAYMREHLGEPVTIVDLARAAGYSEFHFARTFARVVGCTPARHLTKLRMDEAARLLVETDLKVADVCTRVGLASVGTFSSSFAARYGTPPTVFRRHNRLHNPDAEAATRATAPPDEIPGTRPVSASRGSPD